MSMLVRTAGRFAMAVLFGTVAIGADAAPMPSGLSADRSSTLAAPASSTLVASTSTAARPGGRTARRGVVPPTPMGQSDLVQFRRQIENLADWRSTRVVMPAGAPETATVELTIEGETMIVDLSRRSLRAADFRVVAELEDGSLVEVTAPPVRTYEGIVRGSAGSKVAAALLESGFHATIELADGERWFVEPAIEGIDTTFVGEHMTYRADEIVPMGLCGNDLFDMQPTLFNDEPQGGEEGGLAGTGLRLAEIAIDCDFEYYAKNSNSVTLTVNDVEALMNNVTFVYERDVNITYEIAIIVIRTNSGSQPYTSLDAGTLLCQFRSTWNTSPENAVQREMAHLFTGKNLNGSTIGLAWVGVACNQAGFQCGSFGNLAYALSEAKKSGFSLGFRTALVAHEIGHKWGANHCDGAGGGCFIMCSGLNGCSGVSGSNLKFGPSEQTAITAGLNSVSCPLNLADPISPPFVETFPSAGINSTRWIYNQGVVTSQNGQNPPSAPRTMALNAAGSGLYQYDDIRSNFIQLGGLPAATLSYWTQHVGVEAGESLIVEYMNSVGKWTLINEIVSNGVNQTQFTFHEHALPANARHDGFRVRFRTNVDQTNDNWYVDDIFVGEPAPEPEGPPNDECIAAIEVGVGATPFTTVNGTTSVPPPPVNCVGGSMVNDIWFTYLPECDGVVTISTCGTADFDTRIAVYAQALGCPLLTTFTLACSDDEPGCGNGTSEVSLAVEAGFGLIIRVGGTSGSGTGTLNITCAAPPPANDECDGAMAAGTGVTAFSTKNATTSVPAPPVSCMGGIIEKDLWFTHTVECDGELTISTCGSADFDTKLIVYIGSVGCDGAFLPPLSCNDDGVDCPNGTSSVTFAAVAGQQLLIRVGGAAGAAGDGTLVISCEGPKAPPCPADLNGDGVVDGADLGLMLNAWGGAGAADLNGDGVVDGADLGLMLNAWGGCAEP